MGSKGNLKPPGPPAPTQFHMHTLYSGTSSLCRWLVTGICSLLSWPHLWEFLKTEEHSTSQLSATGGEEPHPRTQQVLVAGARPRVGREGGPGQGARTRSSAEGIWTPPPRAEAPALVEAEVCWCPPRSPARLPWLKLSQAVREPGLGCGGKITELTMVEQPVVGASCLACGHSSQGRVGDQTTGERAACRGGPVSSGNRGSVPQGGGCPHYRWPGWAKLPACPSAAGEHLLCARFRSWPCRGSWSKFLTSLCLSFLINKPG